MSGGDHNRGEGRCWHIWRWRHQYVRGWHCGACCVTFSVAKYPTSGTSRKVSS